MKLKIMKKINDQKFKDFLYQAPSYSAKCLYVPDKIKNDEIIKHINNGLIELRNSISRKEILGKENPEKIVDIVEKVLISSNQQKSKECSRMLVLFPSDLARVARVAKVSSQSQTNASKITNSISKSTSRSR